MRPRHEYFNVKKVDLKILNQHCLNGFNIVPAQPFGFNCLGGKLAALICVCHEVREAWDDKYNADIVFFETLARLVHILNRFASQAAHILLSF